VQPSIFIAASEGWGETVSDPVLARQIRDGNLARFKAAMEIASGPEREVDDYQCRPPVRQQSSGRGLEDGAGNSDTESSRRHCESSGRRQSRGPRWGPVRSLEEGHLRT